MVFPTDHPTLTFTKRFTFDNVPAKTSLWATVEITARSIPSTCNNATKRSVSLEKRSGGGGGCVSAYMQWSAPCGGEDKYDLFIWETK